VLRPPESRPRILRLAIAVRQIIEAELIAGRESNGHGIGSQLSIDNCNNDADHCADHVEGEVFQAGREGVVLLAENVDDELLHQRKHQQG
jgi:hypothetical protein